MASTNEPCGTRDQVQRARQKLFEFEDDLHLWFNVHVSQGFIDDTIELFALNFYRRLDERMAAVALRQKRWDQVVLRLCDLSNVEVDASILDLVYNHMGSVVAQYSTPKALSPIPDAFNSTLGLDFVGAWFQLDSGSVSYYHHGRYVGQIEPRWQT